MTQFSLDFARARRTDPLTSQAAADRVTFAGKHYAVIVLALKDRGPMTVAEIAAWTRLNEQQVNKRLPELQRLRAVRVVMVDGADLTRPGPSGRMQRVWEAV